MMSTQYQKLSFIFCLVISLYVLAIGIPGQISKHFSHPQTSAEVATEKPDKSPESILSLSDSLQSKVIQVKKSGEEPLPLTDDVEAYLSVRENFERRFGHSFEDGWKDRDPLHHKFPMPEAIEPMVEFWIHIFGRYGKNQYLIHHRNSVGIVYVAIDLSGLSSGSSGMSPALAKKLRSQFLVEEKMRIRNLLKALPKKVRHKEALTKEEKRIVGLFAKEHNVSLADAYKKENMGVHGGFAHRFKKAIAISGRYMKEMENIFTMKGLPVELTRIPFVESAFNIRAVSSAKAVGLWQFIPPTGKRYLNIDDITDERRDPILATYAAATHLGKEYKLLGSWALAINAYNTGPGRMIAAKKQLKTTDIGTIIKNFKSPGYKFYSRNYYPEFLAAVYVYDNQVHFFGKVKKFAPLKYDFFSPRSDVNLGDLADMIDIDPDLMERLNPALSKEVLNGDYDLPAGYLVKVPKKMGARFAKAASSLRDSISRAQWHIVERGDSLRSIADYYDIPFNRIEKANSLLPGQKLATGTIIKLPRDTGVALSDEKSKNDDDDDEPEKL